MRMFDVVIVGAGHGGAQVAIALRQRGFTGTIAMIGEEGELPYERPPLSKEYLAGAKTFERILIRPAAFWTDRSVAVLTGERVERVDAPRRQVATAAGRTYGYGKLVWAAGGHARRLSCEGGDLRGVHTVRNRADVDSLIGELAGTERVCIVGAGYIGLEAAAALVKFGKRVTVLEAQDRALARVAGTLISRFVEEEHRSHGVELRFAAQVDALTGREGRVDGVRLSSGEVIACDMVIVGIGIVPAVEPLRVAGATCSNGGVDVDAHARTSLADVYALGDCAAHANRFADGEVLRIESVQNAVDMAAVVAADLIGAGKPYDAIPWFWSNQYDLRLQTVGLLRGYDRELLRGDPGAQSFSVVYLRQERVVALDCVNATRDYVQGRKLVEAGAMPDVRLLTDPAVALKDLV